MTKPTDAGYFYFQAVSWGSVLSLPPRVQRLGGTVSFRLFLGDDWFDPLKAGPARAASFLAHRGHSGGSAPTHPLLKLGSEFAMTGVDSKHAARRAESLSRCRDQVELLEPRSDKWHRGLAPRRLLRPSWLPIRPPLIWSSPPDQGHWPTHPARDVLRRCYTGYSLLCQGEMLSKF